MTKTEAAKVVAHLLALWTQTAVGVETKRLYEQHLVDLEFEATVVAIDRLAKTAKWLPSVAEIRETVVDVTHGPKRLGGEAYGDVIAEIRRVGAYGVPRFEDPAVAESVAAMGWRALCLGENEASDRARFVDLYEGLQDRARADVAVGRALPPARGLRALPQASSAGPAPIGELLGKVGRGG